MYKMLKFGVGAGVLALLTACGSSEHFMQDDVYSTRTPIMPPGTDLNDVTDYATFVAKKEQEAEPERTAYVSPREYSDYFYRSQYYFYGYSPYSTLTGVSYFGYGNFHYPPGYGVGYGSTMFYPHMNGGPWHYNAQMGFGNPYGYYPYGGYYFPGAGNPYYNYYPNHTGANWYSTPSSKPKTVNNLSRAHAGVRGSNAAPVGYPHQIAANPGLSGRTSGIRTTSGARIGNVAAPANPGNGAGRSSATVNNRVESVRPSTGSSGRVNPAVQRTNSDYRQRPAVNSGAARESRPTINNNNSTPTRTSTPTMRSGGSSGGIAPSSSGSSGGSRSGGRR